MHHLDARLVDQGHNLIITDGATWDNTYGVGIYATVEDERPASIVEKIQKKQYQEQIFQQQLKPHLLPLLEKSGLRASVEKVYDRYFGYDD
jgi:accessory colonization factor AcfC